jgi:hypothetical protein
VWQIGGSFESSGITLTVPAPTTLLDVYPGAGLAYSFRKLRDAYAGSAVRIRRDSDNAEADIGFSGNDFDTAAAAAHIGGAIGYIVTWYDQSGNGLDCTQATVINQPLYNATGISSLPAVQFDGSNDYLLRASMDLSTYISSQGTILSVMQQQSGTAQNTLLSWISTTSIAIHPTYDDVIYLDFANNGTGRVNVAQPTGWDNDAHILECYRDSSDDQHIVVDGVSLANATRTPDITTGSAEFDIGRHAGLGALFGGYISELVIWGTDLAGSRTAARNNLNAYWSAF